MGEKEYKRVQKVKKEYKRVLFLQIFKKEYKGRKGVRLGLLELVEQNI